jgi:hypothetical protein
MSTRAAGIIAVVSLALAGWAAPVNASPISPAAPPAAASGDSDARPAPGTPRQREGLVRTETQLRRAWADPLRTRIDLDADIVLRDCFLGDPIRESPYPLLLEGHGHTIRQSCFEKRVLRQDGTGWLDVRNVTLTRGGSDGPGAALTSRGEIMLRNCAVLQNLAEEPGGGVFSMRRVTVHRCAITGNLANDDGGGIYARRGGVQVYDSVLSTNLVDGSGGAIGSTGDILVVRTKVDGNTTDGDGGALYADEDGDVTVVSSLIDGSDADGPGGAIFTLDGDVAVLDSTLIGNRADDRGGAISGEADVLVVNSTIARNLAVAHAGGGIWSRGSLLAINSTITNNYAEGEGGGLLSAGRVSLVYSTLTANIAPVGGDLGAAGVLASYGTILGPPVTEGVTGDTIPTRRACRVYEGITRGHNFVSDDSCGLTGATDHLGEQPMLAPLEDDPHGFVLQPLPGSPVRGRIPAADCRPPLPARIPAEQLLERWVDWEQVLTHDAVGTPRTTGSACDIGAVQSSPVGAATASRPEVPTGHVGPFRRPHQQPGRDLQAAFRSPALARTSQATAGAGLGALVSTPSRRTPRAALATLDRRLRVLRREAARFETLHGCMRRVGVSEAGDSRHRWGYLYDERDGTGVDRRPALTRDRTAPRWHLLKLGTSGPCLSDAADPNGAGEDAREVRRHARRVTSLPRLLRWLHRLEARASAVETDTERFDDWESCLSWLPVTEAGDVTHHHGFLLDRPQRHGAAIHIDTSEWDDPDYQLLAFRRRDRPFRGGECGTDPGEGVDRPTVARHRSHGERETWADLREGIRDLREDVEDLAEPVDEISRFDQCLYTVGVASRHGYRLRTRAGNVRVRSALAFDMRGPHLPRLNVMAFPGEEPPQIECNEDAGGVATDE